MADPVRVFESAGAAATLMKVKNDAGWDVANKVVDKVMSARDPVAAAARWAKKVRADARSGSGRIDANTALARAEEVAGSGSHVPDDFDLF
jgi:hypothetical protein